MSQEVIFVFANDPGCLMPIDCAVGGETWMSARKKVANIMGSTQREEFSWQFYRPGRKIDQTLPFIPTNEDHRIQLEETIHPSHLESADSVIQVVIFISNAFSSMSQIPRLVMKKSMALEFPGGLLYVPPKRGRLVRSEGASWDYQVSNDLVKQLRWHVTDHHYYFSNGYIDKSSIPLYLFASGSGTGKSRNSAELHETILKCFDGTYSHHDQHLTQTFKNPIVFHVTLENGQGPLSREDNPIEMIGLRMLHQLLRDKISLDQLAAQWSPPHPREVLEAVERCTANQHFGGVPRTTFLVVDGLRVIAKLHGEEGMVILLSELGNLGDSENSFRIICATSTISGPIDNFFTASRRKRVFLPCSPINPPTIQGREVFRTGTLLEDILVKDCGGHGRALEVMSRVLQTYPEDPNSEVASNVLQYFINDYEEAVPSDGAEAVFKAVMANRLVDKYKAIPGTEVTPDELCQSGLVTFNYDPRTGGRRKGYLRVPYIWILIFARQCRDGRYVEELQLMDYRDFQAKDNPTIASGFSWADFEKLMIKIRKLKSKSYGEGEKVLVGDFHRGAAMDFETAEVEFRNWSLIDDICIHQIGTMSTSTNLVKWSVATQNFGEIDLRANKCVVRNASSASSGDAVLCLDTRPKPLAEVHQYKFVKQGNVNFDKERKKAASPSDIFVLFCTSSIPSLKFGDTYNVPPRSVLVTKENWETYFGPYAGRSFIIAERFLNSPQ